MSRFELGGYGPPIPLPEDGLELGEDDTTGLRPLVISLKDGEVFKPADYSTFGYTHYEVIVIGGCGGKGGNSGIMVGATVLGETQSYGGGGGGGGLHIVAGALADLPEEGVPVQVGLAGADGVKGSNQPRYVSTLVDGQLIYFDHGIGHNPPYSNSGVPIPPYHKMDDGALYDWVFEPNPLRIEPTDGEDGGTSKFGDIAVASGGKGGKKGTYFRQISYTSNQAMEYGPGGFGGDGGLGGREEAGGGGAGGSYVKNWYPEHTAGGLSFHYANSTFTEPEDGTWDGTIGGGGGGGVGGATGPRTEISPINPDL